MGEDILRAEAQGFMVIIYHTHKDTQEEVNTSFEVGSEAEAIEIARRINA